MAIDSRYSITVGFYPLLPSRNPFKYHEEVLYLQPMIPPKRFDIFSLDWGMLRRCRCVQIFLLTNSTNSYSSNSAGGM